MLGVIGAGAMGGALSIQLERAGHPVTIFTTQFDAPFVDAHLAGKPHPALDVHLSRDVGFVEHARWPDLLPKCETVVLAVATVGLVDTVRACAPYLPDHAIWVVATKGWDESTLRSAAGLVADECGDPNRVVALIGPSLASEIAQGVPTAVVCASESAHAARHAAELFDSPRFRTYTSTDVAGVEVGAICKNVVAIAIGMCDGLAKEFEVTSMLNTKAFVFSRGLVETARLARAMGGRAETVLGLAGAGDLFVTALGGRNGKFGALVGGGMTPDDALESMGTTVEGYANARALAVLAAKYGWTFPSSIWSTRFCITGWRRAKR
jgi:glycerol-3-phosphate dehydrogenase (NAD(P)+)